MQVSQRVSASTLEEVNLGSADKQKTVLIVKDMVQYDKIAMVKLLQEYKDVFA